MNIQQARDFIRGYWLAFAEKYLGYFLLKYYFPRAEATRDMLHAAEMLHVVLCNVSGGDWTKQTPEWQEYAAKWSTHYVQTSKAFCDSLKRLPRL